MLSICYLVVWTYFRDEAGVHVESMSCNKYYSQPGSDRSVFCVWEVDWEGSADCEKASLYYEKKKERSMCREVFIVVILMKIYSGKYMCHRESL